MVNDIGRKGLDRSNSVVAAVLSGFANGCEFCHHGCYKFYRQKKPPYVLSAVSGSSALAHPTPSVSSLRQKFCEI